MDRLRTIDFDAHVHDCNHSQRDHRCFWITNGVGSEFGRRKAHLPGVRMSFLVCGDDLLTSILIEILRLTTDLTERHSVLSLLIGGVPFYIYTCSMGQEMMQRYISLPTINDANRALLMFVILLSAFTLICSYNGLLIYAWYAGCDPLQTKVCFEYQSVRSKPKLRFLFS